MHRKSSWKLVIIISALPITKKQKETDAGSWLEAQASEPLKTIRDC